jgi:phosphoribosylglycinamide formyltransferase 1
LKISILGSGKGSNAKYLLSEFKNGKLSNVQDISLFSDSENSQFLKLASEFGCYGKHVPTPTKGSVIKGTYETDWINSLSKLQPDLIILAGFMRIVGINFINHFDGNIINLHPSLLPHFKGLNAIENAFKMNVARTGCTVHWVDNTIDGGDIIAQASIQVFKNESLESLTSRIHSQEHFILSQVVCALADTHVLKKT